MLPPFHPSPQVKQITSFIKKTLKASKHAKLVVAASGGLDSSLALALAAQAIGKANVYVLKLPYQSTHPQALDNASLVIKHLKIPKKNVLEANIGETVDNIWKTILIKLSPSQTGNTKDINEIRLGNVMARVRMVYLFDTAKALRALVVGTENRSEELLGYYTRFGDQASDLEPLKHLYKTQVKQLAQYLKLPAAIIDQTPTAGLWPDQTDEAELGFAYELADQILYLNFDKKLPPAKIATHFPKKLVAKVLAKAQASAFKQFLPYHL